MTVPEEFFRFECQVSEVNPRANLKYLIDIEKPPDCNSLSGIKVNCICLFEHFLEFSLMIFPFC